MLNSGVSSMWELTYFLYFNQLVKACGGYL